MTKDPSILFALVVKNLCTDESVPMSTRICSVMDLASRSSQPAIKYLSFENENQNDLKERKRHASLMNIVGEGTSNDQAKVYKYQWGVRVPINSSDLRPNKQSPNYVVTRKRGTQASKSRKSENSSVQKTPDVIAMEATAVKPVEAANEKSWNVPAAESIGKASDKSSSGVTLAQSLTPESLSLVEKKVEPSSINIKLTVTPTSVLSSDTSINGDDDYNIPKEMPYNGEILAWQDVVTRSKLHEHELAHRTATGTEIQINPVGMIFIRPEPPERRVDVDIVRAVGKVGLPNANVQNGLDPGTNIVGINFTQSRKFSRSCRDSAKSFSTTSRCGRENLPPDSDDPGQSETPEKRGASVRNTVSSKVDENLNNFLPELSQREMEILMSYEQQSSEDNGSLTTPVEIKNIPDESSRDSLGMATSDDDEKFNESSAGIAQTEESAKTMLSLKESDDKDDGKAEISEKKSIKDGDYIKTPGDPYPYSREHYEKWRLPHGKCPIVNDDVPKVKPAETNDSPR